MLPAGQAFPGGWTLTASDAGRLRLERAASLERKDVLRRVGFLLIPLVFCVVTLAGTWDSDFGLKLMAWPVAALLAVVVLLGLASVVRAARRASAGVRLEIDAGARTVTGFPQARGRLSDYRGECLTARFEDIAKVQLAVFRGAPPTSLALLLVSVQLTSGPQLQGPELAVPDAEWEAARDRLAPLAAELARRIGCPNDLVLTPAAT